MRLQIILLLALFVVAVVLAVVLAVNSNEESYTGRVVDSFEVEEQAVSVDSYDAIIVNSGDTT